MALAAERRLPEEIVEAHPYLNADEVQVALRYTACCSEETSDAAVGNVGVALMKGAAA